MLGLGIEFRAWGLDVNKLGVVFGFIKRINAIIFRDLYVMEHLSTLQWIFS